MPEAGVCAGIDWANDTHDVFVADAAGEQLWSETIAHTEAGIQKLRRTLVVLHVAGVAVERPDALLIERPPHAGLTVLAIHPTTVAAAPRAPTRGREVLVERRVALCS